MTFELTSESADGTAFGLSRSRLRRHLSSASLGRSDALFAVILSEAKDLRLVAATQSQGERVYRFGGTPAGSLAPLSGVGCAGSTFSMPGTIVVDARYLW